MSKIDKDHLDSSHYLVGGLVALFTFVVGVLFGGLALTDYSKMDLEKWSKVGDMLNPYIALLSAALVLIGLWITAKDFRLARQEFSATSKELGIANDLSREQAKDEEKEKEIELALKKVEENFKVMQAYEFRTPIKVNTMIVKMDGVYISNANWKECTQLFDLLSIVTLRTTDSLDNSQLQNSLISRSEYQSLCNDITRSYSGPIEWVAPYNAFFELLSLSGLLENYVESVNNYISLAGKEEASVHLKYQNKDLSKLQSLLLLYIAVPDEAKKNTDKVVDYQGSTLNLRDLSEAMKTSDSILEDFTFLQF